MFAEDNSTNMKKQRGKYGHGRVYRPTYFDKFGKKKKVNRWYIQFYDTDGNQVRESTDARTEKEARGILAVKLGRVYTGNAPHIEEKNLRYGDIRQDLLDHFRVEKMASLEILSDGSESAKGLTRLDQFFDYSPNDKGIKISAFDPRKWDKDFITKRRLEGVSDATIINSAKLLDRMLKLAVENKRLTVAPKVRIPKAPKAREVFLTKEQFDLLLEPNGMEERFYPLLTFLFFQGVRISETLNIEWRQVDLENGVFKPNADRNKTEDDRPKPLQRQTIQALKTIKRNGDFVFEDARSVGENPSKKFEKAFRAAMLRLELGGPAWQCSQCREVNREAAAPVSADSPAVACTNPKCVNVPMSYHYVGPTPHCLRASCVVFYRESGLSDAEIMRITGHTTTKSFLGYSRTSVENVKVRMDVAEQSRQRAQKSLVLVA
jgi:integrase